MTEAGVLRIEQPRSVAEAWQRGTALGSSGAWVAGGTALQLGWGEAPPALTLININHLPEAQGVGLVAGCLRIGAAVRLEALRRDALLQLHAPLLVQACASLAALSVRHLATLGGNIGWRCGDALVALLALQAQAELADGRCQALAQLLEAHPAPAPLPLILAVRLALRPVVALAVFEKLGHRAAFSPSRLVLALVAGQWVDGRLLQLRIAAGAAGLPARRLHQAEALLLQAPAGGVGLAALHQACSQGLPDGPAAARLASRLLAGHLLAGRSGLLTVCA